MMIYIINALLHMFCLFKLLHVIELIVIYTNVGQLFIILIKLVLDTHLVL